ncbi:molybdopterin converting factor subunit 1 [Halobacillus locisalis]|uniref:Molybdopterin synthase sulfur carrier subunit n=1 Tax=Halobacillus locisalis TaxID=220753 RepID=A0A838CRD0_9BACI|nr:molybdopterin converting factor subunit 1 [Halobacillus locisalis]
MNQVLFFAELREKTGVYKVDVELTGFSVNQVKEWVAKDYSMPKVQDAMVAINEEFALNETIIENGDVIAFIPPVSGG